MVKLIETFDQPFDSYISVKFEAKGQFCLQILVAFFDESLIELSLKIKDQKKLVRLK